ncbi:hypothetical protein KJ965_00455, partial [Patescibacteria group bacterium]|nr:hypothetical protein [Patescibacteria group bacterium]
NRLIETGRKFFYLVATAGLLCGCGTPIEPTSLPSAPAEAAAALSPAMLEQIVPGQTIVVADFLPELVNTGVGSYSELVANQIGTVNPQSLEEMIKLMDYLGERNLTIVLPNRIFGVVRNTPTEAETMGLNIDFFRLTPTDIPNVYDICLPPDSLIIATEAGDLSTITRQLAGTLTHDLRTNSIWLEAPEDILQVEIWLAQSEPLTLRYEPAEWWEIIGARGISQVSEFQSIARLDEAIAFSEQKWGTAAAEAAGAEITAGTVWNIGGEVVLADDFYQLGCFEKFNVFDDLLVAYKQAVASNAIEEITRLEGILETMIKGISHVEELGELVHIAAAQTVVLTPEETSEAAFFTQLGKHSLDRLFQIDKNFWANKVFECIRITEFGVEERAFIRTLQPAQMKEWVSFVCEGIKDASTTEEALILAREMSNDWLARQGFSKAVGAAAVETEAIAARAGGITVAPEAATASASNLPAELQTMESFMAFAANTANRIYFRSGGYGLLIPGLSAGDMVLGAAGGVLFIASLPSTVAGSTELVIDLRNLGESVQIGGTCSIGKCVFIHPTDGELSNALISLGLEDTPAMHAYSLTLDELWGLLHYRANDGIPFGHLVFRQDNPGNSSSRRTDFDGVAPIIFSLDSIGAPTETQPQEEAIIKIENLATGEITNLIFTHGRWVVRDGSLQLAHPVIIQGVGISTHTADRILSIDITGEMGEPSIWFLPTWNYD